MGSKEIYEIDYTKSTQLSDVEAEILSQYQFLAVQLNTLAKEIRQLSITNNEVTLEQVPETGSEGVVGELLENLRNLEMKIGLVYTLFKGAVYSLFLDNEQDNAQDAEEFESEQEGETEEAEDAEDEEEPEEVDEGE